MAFAVAIAGCTSTGSDTTAATTTAINSAIPGSAGTPTAPVSSIPAGTPVASTAAPPGSADYKISPLDVLDISVFQVPDLTKTVQVSSSGKITLPLVGAVSASGKTTEGLERDLTAKLGAKYLQSPQVTVLVKEYTSQRVTVEGAIKKPGIYPMTGRTTLLQTIAMAGGLERIADERGIVVFREANGKRTAAKFDLPAIRSGDSSDPILLGGDIVVVDQHGGKTALRGVRESLSIFGFFTPFI